MIDTNVYLSRWPFRRLPLDEPEKLLAKLDMMEVEQAWVGSFDALLHRDIEGVNRRLVELCKTVGNGRLLPFGTVNPTLPDWQEDFRRCAEDYGMRGIRLHPNYHGYTLGVERFGELLGKAAEANLIVQIALRMEDDRTQHPLVQVPDVDVQPLVPLLVRHPELQVMLINSQRSLSAAVLEELTNRPHVSFEIAMLEGVGGIGKSIRTLPHERLMFGSYAPFFLPESAQLKLQESELGQTIRKAIEYGNAQQLLARSR